MALIARQEGPVDQIVFRWDTENSLGTTGFGPVAWSCDRDTAETLFNNAAPMLRTTASETVPALVRLERRGQALLVRRAPVLDPDGHSGAVCHALYGPTRALDPETCLGLHTWAWEGGGLPLGEVRGALEQVRVVELLASAEDGRHALLAGLAELAEPLTTLAAELLRHPGQRFTVLDRHGGDGPCRMLWGLYGIFSGVFPEGWTFATHDTVETPATRFVFVRRWPGPAPQSTERLRTDPGERTDDRAQALAAGLVDHYLRRIGRGEGEEYEVAAALAAVSGPRQPGAHGSLLDSAEEALVRLTERQPRGRERDPRERDPMERDPMERDPYEERPPSPPRVPYDRHRPDPYEDSYGDRRGDYPADRYAPSGPDDRRAGRPAHEPLGPSRYSSHPAPSPDPAPPVRQAPEPRRQGRRMFRPVPPEWPVAPESAGFFTTRRKITVQLDHLLAVLHTFHEPNASSRNVRDALRGSGNKSLVAAMEEEGLHYAAVTVLVEEIATRYGDWPRNRRHDLCQAVLRRELFVGDRPWPAAVGLPSRETRAANAAALYGWAVGPFAGLDPVRVRLLELLPRLSCDAGGAGRAAVEQILEGEKAPGLGKEVWLAIVRAGWRDGGPAPAAPAPAPPTPPGTPALPTPRPPYGTAPGFGGGPATGSATTAGPGPGPAAPAGPGPGPATPAGPGPGPASGPAQGPSATPYRTPTPPPSPPPSAVPPPPPPPAPPLPPLPPRQKGSPGAPGSGGAPLLRSLARFFGIGADAASDGGGRESGRRPSDGRIFVAALVVLFVVIVSFLVIEMSR
ncbi:hypothetical protein AB0P17_10455 [Streptomyces sp. NPDC088124]|uniref:hypothetical protein n=1 Tax=Streptomyces sp. NPDC088124 TaxID=3154654 RepID=UPI003432D3C9